MLEGGTLIASVVPGWASSPKPGLAWPQKPGPGLAHYWASAGSGPGFSSEVEQRALDGAQSSEYHIQIDSCLAHILQVLAICCVGLDCHCWPCARDCHRHLPLPLKVNMSASYLSVVASYCISLYTTGSNKIVFFSHRLIYNIRIVIRIMYNYWCILVVLVMELDGSVQCCTELRGAMRVWPTLWSTMEHYESYRVHYEAL